MAAACHQLGSGIYTSCVTGAIAGAEVLGGQRTLTLTTAMLDDAGDLIPFAPAAYREMLHSFKLVTTDLDGGTALVYSLVLTNIPGLGGSLTATGAASYNVITGITTGQSAGVYDLDAQAYAVVAAAKMKQVPSGNWSWALKITTPAGTPAAGTMIITFQTLCGYQDAGSTTVIPEFS